MRWIGWMWMVSMLLSAAAGAAEPLARCARLAGSEETALVLRSAPGQAPLIESRAGSFVPKGLIPWPAGFSAVGFRVRLFDLEGRTFTVVEVQSKGGSAPALSLSSACVLDDQGRDTGVGFPVALDNPCGQSYRAAWSIRPLPGDALGLCVTWIDWPREKAAWGDRGTTGTWPICGDLTVGESWYRLDERGALVGMGKGEYRILAGLRPAAAGPAPGRDAALHRSLAALAPTKREELETSLVRWREAMLDGWQEGARTMKDLRALRSMNILIRSLGGADDIAPETVAAAADGPIATGANSPGTPSLARVSLARRRTAP